MTDYRRQAPCKRTARLCRQQGSRTGEISWKSDQKPWMSHPMRRPTAISANPILTAMRNEPNQSLTGKSMADSRGPTHVSISIFLLKRNTAIAGSSPWKADRRAMRIFVAEVRRAEEGSLGKGGGNKGRTRE